MAFFVCYNRRKGGFDLVKQNPEETREKLRQTELKSPASGVQGSNLSDLVGGLNWKVTGMILIILIVSTIIYLLVR